MNNEFDNRFKKIEQEIIDLKTSSKYTSVRSAKYSYGTLVYTGVYRITFDVGSEQLFSISYGTVTGEGVALVEERTPNGNQQIIDVVTTYYNGSSYVTRQIPLSVVSNVPVVSIERIS
jgi:hypothetical protein